MFASTYNYIISFIYTKEELFLNAAENGDIETIKQLLNTDININTYDGRFENTALINAIKNKHNKIVELLINAGADVNKQNYNGHTALIYAIKNFNTQIAKLLIDAKVNVNQAKNNKTPLMYAAEYDQWQIAQMLIDAGADINKQSDNDETALMYACESNSVRILKMLIDAGADVNKQNRQDKTALMMATRDNSGILVKMLIDAGADVNKVNYRNKTALLCAIIHRNPKNALLLLNAGANVLDDFGENVVSWICDPSYLPIIKILIEKGACDKQLNNEEKEIFNLVDIELDKNKQIREQALTIKQLNLRIAELEYAPGGVGYEATKQHFDEIKQQ